MSHVTVSLEVSQQHFLNLLYDQCQRDKRTCTLLHRMDTF